MTEGPGNAADLAERFENALYNIAKGWRHAVDRRLKYMGISLASIELGKLAHLTELLEQVQCIFRPRHDDLPFDQDRCDC
jgi:hypothetical protein